MFRSTGLVAALVLALTLPAGAEAATARLRTFGSCGDLVRFGQLNLRNPREVAPMAPVATRPIMRGGGDQQFSDAVGGVPGAPQAATPGPSAGSDEASGTNVQEAGVDEPDLVKSDGRRLLALVAGALVAVDVSSATPRLLGSLPLAGAGTELLVRGDRALVVGTDWGPAGAQTRITEVDVRDAGAMRIARTMTAPGQYVSARQTGATARVVLTSPPAVTPAQRRGAAVHRFVPRTLLRSRVTGNTYRRQLVRCTSVRRPRLASGPDLLTVLTIDLDRGLIDVERDGVMAAAQTVYASRTGLVVASQALDAVDATELHRFDTSQAGTTTYAASGRVAGSVLNQFALSEHAGHLRVATTEGTAGESRVTVLAERAGRLVEVGRVAGLGRGERIYAVRFLGDVGYVVTFRQVDPLYTLDLARPEAPRVVGELKILGYSAYLHPLGDDLLLGVGQDATDQGQRLGAQVSLFDVSDPRRPARLAARPLGGQGQSEAETDHHAFLWWPAARLAVLPAPDGAALGLHVRRAEGLREAGRVVHEGGRQGAVRRALVVRGRLVTVSAHGVGIHRLDTLAPLGFAAFPVP